MGRPLEECVARHKESRRAEAALQGEVLDERVLHRVQLAVACESFNGGDLASIRLDGEHQTRLHECAIHAIAAIHSRRVAVSNTSASASGASLPSSGICGSPVCTTGCVCEVSSVATIFSAASPVRSVPVMSGKAALLTGHDLDWVSTR